MCPARTNCYHLLKQIFVGASYSSPTTSFPLLPTLSTTDRIKFDSTVSNDVKGEAKNERSHTHKQKENMSPLSSNTKENNVYVCMHACK